MLLLLLGCPTPLDSSTSSQSNTAKTEQVAQNTDHKGQGGQHGQGSHGVNVGQGGQNGPSNAQPPDPTKPAFPTNMPGVDPSENLKSSWRKELALSWTVEETSVDCPDIDGDGLFDAKVDGCGATYPSEKLDCDDSNPNIGFAQEIYIPAGYFIMGSASSLAGADEAPVEAVWLDGYCLNRDEVSNKDFVAWLKSEDREAKGFDTRNLKGGLADPARDAYPAEGVTWQEAHDFCTTKGQALPTEAQWEKSARGGCELDGNETQCEPEDLRAYPWGAAAPSCELANHQNSADGAPELCVSDTLLADALTAGAGPYGHNHLAGNVWEYVEDVWHPSVYAKDRRNPAGPKSGDIHVLRGGSWNTFSTNMRAANRFHDLVMGSAAGFRCARSFTKQVFDDVQPLVLAPVTGTIEGDKPLEGRALYVSAFDAADAGQDGMLAPGRSPIAEIRLKPNGTKKQSFEIKLPKGGKYIISAALDAGTGNKKEEYVSASGSGGFAKAKQNPVSVEGDVTGILIEMQYAPVGGPNGPSSPNKMPTPK